MILLLPNRHALAWLAAPPEAPGRLLARIRGGEWQPPGDLAARFAIPPGQALVARSASGAVVVRPGRAPLRLTPGQAQVLRLMGQGLSGRQIARALGRSPRWVRYQVAAVKRLCRGAPAAEGH